MSIASIRRRTIWIVDDSVTDAELARQVLAQQHTVEVMHDGARALERLSSEPAPDLLVLDLLMPGVSGLDVCRFVRSLQNRTAELPILIMTAYKQTHQIVEGLEAGANDFLAKPFEHEELLARARALLRVRQLLERAAEAEESVRMLLANAPDAIFAIDAQGRVTYANDEAARILGLSADTIPGRQLHDLIPDLSLLNITIGPGESLLPLPDVKLGDRTFSPSIRILPSDSAANTTIALRDVTVRRQADLRRLDFYSMIAHDLRTPLTAVLLRLELISIGKHGVLPASLTADISKMDGSVRTLMSMINDFLELARFEGIGYKIAHEPVDLAALVQSIGEDFRPLLEVEGLQWQSSWRKRNAFVLGDKNRLTQVISNLIGNAIKFTPRGGSIATTVVLSDAHVEVAVEDTGRGVPAHELERIFQRYTRVSPNDRDASGTGLGLMIVREIVEAHGGVVGVESREG
ncbi:MAG TPA: ATP-binding protein, partial [Haliangium sp.]|nr:ATP-binding protein [Haliangium sp.]